MLIIKKRRIQFYVRSQWIYNYLEIDHFSTIYEEIYKLQATTILTTHNIPNGISLQERKIIFHLAYSFDVAKMLQL